MGTEAFWIPAALTALSAAGSYVNTKSAQGREQQGEVQNILDQQKTQSEARGQLGKLTNSIAQSNPTALAAKATGDYVNTLRKNSAGGKAPPPSVDTLFGRPTSALPTSVNANPRYDQSVANSGAETQQYGTDLSKEMGNIDSAIRQRQGEAGQMQDEATNLNLLGAKSYTQNFVNKLKADAAGVQNPWLALASQALAGAGHAMSVNTPAPGGSIPAGTVLGDGTVAGGVPGSTGTDIWDPWLGSTGATH